MSIAKYNKYFKKYDDNSKFKLGKTYKYNLEKTYIKLYYDNKRVIFQTPALFIPYEPRKNPFNSNGFTLDMSFLNEGYDKDLPDYEEWYYNLEKTVYKLMRKRSYLKANKSGFKTLFKPDEYRYTKKMNISFTEENTRFYVMENVGEISRSRKMEVIDFPCYAFFIMEVQTIWIINNTLKQDTNTKIYPDWGIKLNIHAVQCIPNHNYFNSFKKIEFIPSNSFNFSAAGNNSIPPPPPPLPPINLMSNSGIPPPPPLPNNINGNANNNEVPEFLIKYKKMLKMGIPRDAVKHKMKMAGLDGDLLDNPNKVSTSGTSNTSGPVKITANMLSAVSLKKTIKESPEEKKARLAKEKAKSTGSGFEVSLDEVLSIRNRLKKTGVDTKKRIEKDHYKQYSYENDLSDEEC